MKLRHNSFWRTKLFWTILALCWAAPSYGFHIGAPPDALGVMVDRKTMRPHSSEAKHFRVVSVDRYGNAQETDAYWLSSMEAEGNERHLIRFTGKQFEGTVLIQTTPQGTEVWALEGNMEKPRPIPATQWQDSFFGMAVTWEELIGEPDGAFIYTSDGNKYFDGLACIYVTGKVRNKTASPKIVRREYWITHDGKCPLRGSHYAEDSRLIKSFKVTEFKKDPVDGTPASPARMTYENYESGETSVIVVENVKQDVEIPEDMLTTTYLTDWDEEKDQQILSIVNAK